MSAEGHSTAIVSLGISCQSARQIRTHAEEIGHQLGENIQPARHFFDGLIAPVPGVARLFEDGFPLFGPGNIRMGPHHPVWHPYDIHFLHHFRDEAGAVDIAGRMSEELSRFGHMRGKLQRLSRFERLVFVLSNSQNNLTMVQEETGLTDLHFEASAVGRLRHAVEQYLGRPCEFILVSLDGRHAGDLADEVHVLSPDDSEWTGDKGQWRALLLERLAADRQPD